MMNWLFKTLLKLWADPEKIKMMHDKFGYYVDRLGRDEYKYIEGSHVLIFVADLLTGPINIAIYRDPISKWSPPHDNETITDEERDRILANICSYFDRAGTTYEVI